jgi:hypothetical protein
MSLDVSIAKLIRSLLITVSICLFLFGGLVALTAQELVVQEATSIAPASIPIDSSGDAPSKIGMARLVMRRKPATTTDGSVDKLTIELIGTIDPSDISQIYVFYEQQSLGVTNDGIFDQGTYGSNPSTQIASVAASFDVANPQVIEGLAGSNTITAHNDPNNNGEAYFYIAFDFANGADDSATVGCRIVSVEYGAVGVGTGTTITPNDPDGTTYVDDYYTQLSGSTAGLGLDKGAAGTFVTALQMDFSTPLDGDGSLFAPATGGYVTIDQIRFHVTGTADTGDINSVLVFQDVVGGTAQQYDAGTDVNLGTGSISGSGVGNLYATVPLSTPLQVDSANDQYFAAVLVGTSAVAGRTIGLQVEDPSSTTNLRFIDGIDDDATLPAQVNNFEYPQTGYSTDTASTPLSPDEFTIVPPDNGLPPSITLSIPAPSATNVDPDQVLTFVFSEAIDESTLDTIPDGFGAYDDFVLEDLSATVYPGNLVYSPADKMLKFTPTDPLPWATVLTATVGPNIFDLAPVPEDMGTAYVLIFTTRPEFPEVNEPTVLKNRIGAGANSEAVILIPTPSSGSFSGLSVKVFTTTGRLVKTFRGGEIETISSGRKIIWNGTNDRGAKLGPGIYFVQVRVAGRKSVLKVMIVR